MRSLPFLILFLITIQVTGQNGLSPQTEKKGVYKNFSDYMMGKTSDSYGFYIDSALRTKHVWKGTYSFIPSDKYGPITHVWGFCDGKYNYINFRNSFFKIFKENDYDIVYAYALPNSEEINAEKYLHKYYIDPYTGDLLTSKTILEYYESERRYSEMVIYRIDNSINEEPIHFTINDSLNFSLGHNQFVKLSLPLKKEPYKISYGSENSKELYIYLELTNSTFLECNRIMQDIETIKFRYIHEVLGRTVVNDLEKLQNNIKSKQTK